MQIYRQLLGLAAKDKGASCALGNFDGVHLGHQSVLDVARVHGPLGIITFEPHPRAFFNPTNTAPFRLMNAKARTHEMARLGVKNLYELPFNTEMAALSPRDFAKLILQEGLGVSHVVVGADFCFGARRSGRAKDLVSLGKEFGFGVTVSQLLHTSGAEISSTAIRQALKEGDPQLAQQMLGHPHRIEGPVIHGEKRGRDLGYPTANMAVSDLHLPKLGVYAVLVDVLTGPFKGSYKAASSLGVRPMFGKNQPNLESFLFDFSGDLYGAELSVAFVAYLRPELKFDGLQELRDQMAKDCAQARTILEPL